MPIAIDDKVPEVTFMQMMSDGPTRLGSDELFQGKRILLFGVPGAYTPVCSEKHLPGFIARADELKEKGINSIVCVAANDPFVMAAWAKSYQAGDKIMMLTDPDGAFTRAIGVSLDLADFGLGERSERYAMIVDDGRVEAIEVEDSIFSHDVTSADTMLARL